MKKHQSLLTVVAAAFAIIVSSCVSEKPLAKRVIVVAFDGLCTEGLTQASTPNIDYLASIGTLSMSTRNEMPPATMTNFTTVLTGVGPGVHGVNSNLWTKEEHPLDPAVTDEDGYIPSVFKLLKENVPGIRTAFYWNWEPLIRPFNRKYIDEELLGDKEEVFDNLYDRCKEFLLENKDCPTFTFLYSVHTDAIGHNIGWMTPEYIAAVEEADAELGRLIDFLKGNGMFKDTHIFVVTDHGGDGTHHRNTSPREMVIPWLVEGPGIRRGCSLDEVNSNANTASTILRLFGVPQPYYWTGRVPDVLTK